MRSLLVYLSGVFTTFAALQVTITQGIQFDTPQQHTLQDDETSTTGWPSLEFQFNVKRSTMDIFGQTKFSVMANPVVSADKTSVLYDVFATFRQGSKQFNYTVVDGSAYLSSTSSSVQCLDSELDDFLPINAIVSAINDATPVSSLSPNVGAIKCDSDNLYKVSVRDFDFALCASGDSSFQMYGRYMDIVVEYLETRGDIEAPKIDIECEAEVESSSVTSIGQAILSGTAAAVVNEARELKANFSIFGFGDDDDECNTCKSTRRPCIFVHGLGVKDETPTNEDSLPYWGKNISDHAPCCTSIKYAHLDTVDYTWRNATQQQKVCDRILAVSNTSTDDTISDTIVITHSMGSLMLAGAIAHGRCQLNSTSAWVSTAAPMTGSMASDYAREVCAGEKNFFVEKFAEMKNQCPVNPATKDLAYENGTYASKRLNAAYKSAQKVYREQVYAVMCSESFFGLFSTYQANFWILGHAIPHKSNRNDGTVEFESCAYGLSESKFGNSYHDRFYRAKLNHYDMQFRAGDGLFNKAKMPVKWFQCLL